MSQFAVRNTDAESISSGKNANVVVLDPDVEEPAADRASDAPGSAPRNASTPVDEVEVVVEPLGRLRASARRR